MRPNSNRDRRSLLASMALVCLAGHGLAQSGPSFEMTRMVAHWAQYGQPEYVDFIGRAQPDVAQVGFYGAHFWSLVHTAEYGGYVIGDQIEGMVKEELAGVLKNIQDGSFAKTWIEENKNGRPNFTPRRKREHDLLIEKVGEELRDMMPFLNARRVKQES